MRSVSGLPSPKAAPPHLELMAGSQGHSEVRSVEYWRKLCPLLHCQDKKYQKEAVKTTKKLDPQLTQQFKERMNEDGYFHLPERFFKDHLGSEFFDRFGTSIVHLMQYGWQPTFVNLYDESWVIVNFFSKVMKAVTGNSPNMDMLSWYIDPESAGGFSPHRDRQPSDSPSTFYKDTGMPKYATCWVAITDACPDNSCLYVIPRWQDPGYYDGDDDESELSPLQIALPNKEDYQAIRAVPAPKGSCLFFSHRIIHWGSKGRKGYPIPRIAFSFANSSDDFEPAYFDRKHLPFPTLDLRFALSCGQMICYYDRFQFCGSELQKFHQFFQAESNQFHPTYVQKVLNEFVIALKGRVTTKLGEHDKEAKEKKEAEGKKKRKRKTKARAKSKNMGPEKPKNGNGKKTDDEGEEEALDAALEAMLEGHFAGFGDDFEDDFDALGEEVFEPKQKKQRAK